MKGHSRRVVDVPFDFMVAGYSSVPSGPNLSSPMTALEEV